MNSLTNAIFGKRVLHTLFADDYIDWAGKMLVQDYDSHICESWLGLIDEAAFLKWKCISCVRSKN